MNICDKLLENKDAIQSIVNEIDCSNDKWFMYNHLRNENPVLRNYSTGMTSWIMEKGPQTFRSRFIFLKIMEDMIFQDDRYEQNIIKFNNMKLEMDKYTKVDGGYIRKEVFEERGLLELFSDRRVFSTQYLEATSGVDPHIDPWYYGNCGRDYRNMLLYGEGSTPDDFTLLLNGEPADITSPMQTNYANDTHTYQFDDTPDIPLRLLHIDHKHELS